MKTTIDLSVAAVGVGAEILNGYSGLVTATCAGVYLVCKGIVLVIRELRKKSGK